jgi:large subunit ribosomal protein L6
MKVPEGASVTVEGSEVKVVSNGSEKSRKFDSKKIKVSSASGEVTIEAIARGKKANAMAKSLEAHLANMLESKAFEKKLQVVYAHFPVSIETKGDKVVIKNFLGEKQPREAKIMGKAKVSINGSDITVSGDDKESVGQTASNLVRATRITNKDIRVFQDGIYFA